MYTNRLVDEKSPYLLQHAHNPVDWYPWGEAAFAKARDEGKPIFLSIGYSTCHWCHVMERESFESVEVAEVLNREFVSIKLDREERPDIDRVYMTFVQASTGSGGWPMSVWLTPDLRPFFGGTYFPPDNRYGRPGFKTLLEHIAGVWKNERKKLLESSENIVEQLRQQTEVKAAAAGKGVDEGSFETCFSVFRRTYDRTHCGFGQAPKFPRPVAFDFLLRYYARTKNAEALEMSVDTLHKMADGGMYDHVGGGFHRYSVDEHWFVPHFEKMLYDQAQLATSYLEAFQITGEARMAEVARDIFRYVLADMTHAGGAFNSAEDADSVIDTAHPHEKGEGAFYIWSARELVDVLGEADAAALGKAYGVRANGNVDHDPHGEFTGCNILYRMEGAAAMSEAVRAKLASARSAGRVRPHLDDKVLTAWNALMISALSLGGRVLGEAAYTQAAVRAAEFVLANLRTPDGALLRRWRDGEGAIPAFLDDYAYLATALLDLYETTFDARYLDTARDLTDRMLTLFADDDQGGFFSSAAGDASLILRVKDEYDGAEPAGNSAAALLLFRLYAMTGEERYREAGARTLVAFGPRLRTAPHATPKLMCAAMLAMSAPSQVVIAGDAASPGFAALAAEARRRFAPHRVLLQADTTRLAKTAGMTPASDGRAAAYVCENFACQLPVSDVEALGRLLN
ncbi:MAG: thioredoxin domain-containing protein [Acidobacteria bacterium]|nr:thioredoxin domain-containing protein [Acidobacteriota bacterium]